MTTKNGRLFAPSLLGPSQDAVTALRLRAQREVARSRAATNQGSDAGQRRTVVRDGVVYVVLKKKP